MKRLTVRMSDEDYLALQELAKLNDRNVNNYVNYALKMFINFSLNPNEFSMYHLKAEKVDRA